MNREIKFRGKPVNNEWWFEHLARFASGEWVTGNLVTSGEECWIVGELVEANEDQFCPEFWVLVRPETVGRYTGLKDKNGVKIFEGDIVNYHTVVDCRGIVQLGEYEQDGSGGEYSPTKCIGFFVERKWMDFDFGDDFAVYDKTISLLEAEGLEVVGNIHDNPELLEVPGDV